MFSEEASVIIHRTAYVRLFPGEDRASEHAIGRKTVSPLRAHLVALYTPSKTTTTVDRGTSLRQRYSRPTDRARLLRRKFAPLHIFFSFSLSRTPVRPRHHTCRETDAKLELGLEFRARVWKLWTRSSQSHLVRSYQH